MIRRILLLILVCLPLCAQEQDKAPEYVAKQFGPSFTLLTKYPALIGDLDGDGAEDAVFVVTGSTTKVNPLTDEADFHYKVIDPYDDYFGFGNPKVTVGFAAHDPDQVKYILVVHNWKAATPKAKYLIINLPFEKLSLTRIPFKKKAVTAITAEELGGMTSAIFWDGKRYRWDALTLTE